MPSPAIVTDDAAHARYDIDLEAWGERGWATVARICRWAVAHGASVTCPEAR